jgi:hypothetical protein
MDDFFWGFKNEAWIIVGCYLGLHPPARSLGRDNAIPGQIVSAAWSIKERHMSTWF